MHVLIIGQGISGTMLSWYLHQAKVPFTVIDNAVTNSASKVAAGLINPVTGRRIVTTWMIDKIMPFALNAYTTFGKEFNTEVINQKPIIDFFPTQQMRDAFFDRTKENAPYLSIKSTHTFEQIIQHMGYGIITPAYVVQLATIVTLWRKYLTQNHLLIEDIFDEKELTISDKNITYKERIASHLIYANGYQTEYSKFWDRLPFAPNKGQALLIKCDALDDNYIYKKSISIIPQGNHLFWVGANYEWKYENNLPTEIFKTQTTTQLKEALNVPFEIIEHLAGIRPANMERRPFVGFHPLFNNVGILSGMGAKGSSLAPFFAYELVQHILQQKTITPEADVNRFKRILST